ncbi:MAG: hypothetical protein Q8S71_00300 [Hydrogenophaga sp.]|uniref:alpha/beta hydrolase family protein n=1 Tax=Hydrogenophaga sp. TaxID=1904254 RepID=UPI0027222F28|nr:hypothetical protein [Hydrogenophaga sp.]MDO9253850.1 hypothetical protein [Hydrogenophaga sp.]MDP2406762.1 hypothetical protein [Hydrogenophaga sp.]MDP3321968.1 hypothetical protein [Hydrogenophaga sp.]MDZ4177023.1 hypothetical protein [Hydrogenophaga sp.]
MLPRRSGIATLWMAACTTTLAMTGHAGDQALDALDERFDASHRDIARGPLRLTRAQCEATRHAVWVALTVSKPGQPPRRVDGCIRYFPSPQVAPGQPVLFFFHGDRVEPGGLADGSWRQQMAQAQRIEQRSGMPTISLARPGVYGSTVLNHRYERRTHEEVAVVSATIDRIKARYGFDRISLAGQSGGAYLALAMVVSGRTDIDAVVASGAPAAVRVRAAHLRSNPASDISTGQDWRNVYDPMDHIADARPDARRKVYLIANRDDQRIPYASVLAFVNAAAQGKLPVVLLDGATGGGKQHHNHARLAQRVIRWHRMGLGEQEIARKVAAEAE